MALSTQQIIERGFIDVHVRVSGIRQCHRLSVVKENTAFGQINCLYSRVDIPSSELLRVTEELSLPIKTPKTIVFPRGRGPADFVVVQ